MFHVGQKIICIETWECIGGRGDEVGPVAGKVYTVRAIGIGLNLRHPNSLQVRLREISNPTHLYQVGTYEAAFRASRFRPIEERKTDISIFTAMLNPASKVKETV